jgi:ABC-2 type transport system permease protein
VLMLIYAAAMALTGGQALGGTSALLRDLAGAAIVQIPAIGVLGAAVAMVVIVLPHWSVVPSWLLFVFSVFVGPMFGPSLGLPAWLVDLSPFTHVPNAPAVAISYGPLLSLGVAGALLASVGILGLRRRNLALPA